MYRLILLFVFLVSYISTAQVGINTDLPDPSSILDLTSSDKGFLTPRMTSTEIAAIVDPADGLMVYDTTLNAFKYYDGESWGMMERNNARKNYKLVKSVDDLSDELTAGGGSWYFLETNTLYEINGTIIFDMPINLNGAYIEGVDSSEDILVNASGATFFNGSSGGAFRNLTISGNGQQLFDINGSGTELLLLNNSIIAGASSIGTIQNVQTVFFSINQFVGNQDGLELSNINSFFVSNIFWSGSNTGTFLDLSGSFTNLQMSNGRVETDSGEVGINVSQDPVIVNDATLSNLSFVGDGDYVVPYTNGSYTGFNFSNDWNVNCSGIPRETDETASANIYYGGALTSAYSQTVSSPNGTPFQIKSASNFQATNLFRFSAADNNNDLIYEGKKSRTVQLSVSLSVRVAGADGQFYAFAISKNGTVVDETNSIVRIANSSQIQNVALNGVLQLQPGDRIELVSTRFNGSFTDTIDIFSQNVSIR